MDIAYYPIKKQWVVYLPFKTVGAWCSNSGIFFKVDSNASLEQCDLFASLQLVCDSFAETIQSVTQHLMMLWLVTPSMNTDEGYNSLISAVFLPKDIPLQQKTGCHQD